MTNEFARTTAPTARLPRPPAPSNRVAACTWVIARAAHPDQSDCDCHQFQVRAGPAAPGGVLICPRPISPRRPRALDPLAAIVGYALLITARRERSTLRRTATLPISTLVVWPPSRERHALSIGDGPWVIAVFERFDARIIHHPSKHVPDVSDSLLNSSSASRSCLPRSAERFGV